MEDVKRILEVGDVVFQMNGNFIAGKFVITRATKTRAYYRLSNGNESDSYFRRDVDSYGSVKISDRYKWDSRTFYLSTPEIENKFNYQKDRSFLTEFISIKKIQSLPNNVLKDIVDIIKNYEKGENNGN